MRDKRKEDEAANFQKEVELLLWLVKLFNADPTLALHVCNCRPMISCSFILSVKS